MDSKKIIIPVIALAVLTTGAFAVNKAMANGRNSNSSWTQNLATKLGVDETKVSTAVHEINTEEKQTELNENLTKAVEAGVITEDQKQLVIDKKSEHEQKQQALKNEMQTWATENNIDYTKLQEYLKMGGGKGQMNGRMDGEMPGNRPTDAPQQNANSTN